MGHKIDQRDVEKAFRRYVDVTGDRTATLVRTGNIYEVTGRHRDLEGVGAYTAYLVIHRFVDGFLAGQASPKTKAS